MNKSNFTFIFLFVFLIMLSMNVFSAPFSATWNTSKTSTGSSNATQITLPIYNGGTYNFTVDWGDGTVQTVTTWDSVNKTHNYASAGLYTINITGTIIGFRFASTGDRLKIIDISQWGDLNVGNANSYFSGCANMNFIGSDNLNLSGMTTFSAMFNGATVFNGNISGWNTENITSMGNMFNGVTSFNQNISNWNTGKVTTMASMFQGATSFNQDLSNWNVANVTIMSSLFNGATSFNKSIELWNTGKVTQMDEMFRSATAYNQNMDNWNLSSLTTAVSMFADATNFNGSVENWSFGGSTVTLQAMFQNSNFNRNLSTWNVSKVTAMNNMFQGSKFNNDISTWNTGKVTTMAIMFNNNIVFNQNLDNWNLSSVTTCANMFNSATAFNGSMENWSFGGSTVTLSGMFQNANNFNRNLSTWNTSKVTNMNSMLRGIAFNNDISTWDTSKVTDMGSMFYLSYLFNQNISDWDTSNVTTMSNMFNGATAFNQNIQSWNTGKVTTMASMFQGATAYNQNMDNWNLSSLTTASNMFNGATSFNGSMENWSFKSSISLNFMFSGATKFNRDISTWDTSKAITFQNMFQGATLFNQPLNSWNTSSVTNMQSMFVTATSFNQSLSNWDTSKVTTMQSMFNGATKFNQNISNWDVGKVTNMNNMFQNSIFDQDIGNYNVVNLTTASNMFTNTKLSTENYDALLKGWSSKSLKNNTVFDGGNSTYSNCAGTGNESRNILINNYNWTITDGGFNSTYVCPVTSVNVTITSTSISPTNVYYDTLINSTVNYTNPNNATNFTIYYTIYKNGVNLTTQLSNNTNDTSSFTPLINYNIAKTTGDNITIEYMVSDITTNSSYSNVTVTVLSPVITMTDCNFVYTNNRYYNITNNISCSSYQFLTNLDNITVNGNNNYINFIGDYNGAFTLTNTTYVHFINAYISNKTLPNSNKYYFNLSNVTYSNFDNLRFINQPIGFNFIRVNYSSFNNIYFTGSFIQGVSNPNVITLMQNSILTNWTLYNINANLDSCFFIRNNNGANTNFTINGLNVFNANTPFDCYIVYTGANTPFNIYNLNIINSTVNAPILFNNLAGGYFNITNYSFTNSSISTVFGMSSTKFSQAYNFTIYNNNTLLNYPYINTTVNMPFPTAVFRGNFIALNTSVTGNSGYNKTANITLTKNLSCSATRIAYNPNYVTTYAEVIATNLSYTPSYIDCNDTTNLVTFTVNGFSSYATAEVLPPLVTFVNNTPSNITTTTFGLLNASYNATFRGYDMNLSTAIFYYKTNSTFSDNYYCVNGICLSGYSSRSMFNNGTNNITNETTTLYSLVGDNQYLNGIYNIDEVYMENTLHTSTSLGNTNNYLKIRFYNISNQSVYNTFEIMLNRTSGSENVPVYYCNSSYTTGSVLSSPFCTLFNTITTPDYNHIHSAFSKHQVVPMSINTTTGQINSVKVTPLSYIVMRGTLGNWDYHYITNNSNSVETSDNNGNTYTAETITVDSHIHQLSSAVFYQYACINDTSNYQGCSTIYSTTLYPSSIAPSGLSITIPNSTDFIYKLNDVMIITYTPAISPVGNSIISYQIDLLDNTMSYLSTIISNNSPNLTYNYNLSSLGRGNAYYIKVTATDSQGFQEIAESDYFVINALPVISEITINEPHFDENVTSTVYFGDVNSFDEYLNVYYFVYVNGTLNTSGSFLNVSAFSPQSINLEVDKIHFNIVNVTWYVDDFKENVSDSRTTTVLNYAPGSHTPIILPNTVYRYTDPLILYCNVTDLDGDNQTYNYSLYLNGNLLLNNVTSSLPSNSIVNVINYTITTDIKGDNITFECYSNDAYNDSNVNSTTKQVNNSLPHVVSLQLQTNDNYNLFPNASMRVACAMGDDDFPFDNGTVNYSIYKNGVLMYSNSSINLGGTTYSDYVYFDKVARDNISVSCFGCDNDGCGVTNYSVNQSVKYYRPIINVTTSHAYVNDTFTINCNVTSVDNSTGWVGFYFGIYYPNGTVKYPEYTIQEFSDYYTPHQLNGVYSHTFNFLTDVTNTTQEIPVDFNTIGIGYNLTAFCEVNNIDGGYSSYPYVNTTVGYLPIASPYVVFNNFSDIKFCSNIFCQNTTFALLLNGNSSYNTTTYEFEILVDNISKYSNSSPIVSTSYYNTETLNIEKYKGNNFTVKFRIFDGERYSNYTYNTPSITIGTYTPNYNLLNITNNRLYENDTINFTCQPYDYDINETGAFNITILKNNITEIYNNFTDFVYYGNNTVYSFSISGLNYSESDVIYVYANFVNNWTGYPSVINFTTKNVDFVPYTYSQQLTLNPDLSSCTGVICQNTTFGLQYKGNASHDIVYNYSVYKNGILMLNNQTTVYETPSNLFYSSPRYNFNQTRGDVFTYVMLVYDGERYSSPFTFNRTVGTYIPIYSRVNILNDLYFGQNANVSFYGLDYDTDELQAFRFDFYVNNVSIYSNTTDYIYYSNNTVYQVSLNNVPFVKGDNVFVYATMINKDYPNSNVTSISDNKTVLNTDPYITTSLINPDPAYYDSNFMLYCTGNDFDVADSIQYIWKVYKNGTLLTSGTTGFVPSGVPELVYNGGLLVSRTNNLTLECQGYDGMAYSNKLNSSLLISNYPPNTTNAVINPTTVYKNSTFQFNCQGTDVENDTLRFYYYVTVNGSLVLNGLTSYRPQNTLYNFLNSTLNISKNDVVELTCIANDGIDNSTNNYTINKTVSNDLPSLFYANISNTLYYNTTVNVECGAYDLDGDNYSFLYSIYRNGNLVYSNITSSTYLLDGTLYNVENVTVTKTSMDNITVNCKVLNPDYCYQETANVSTSCGGLNTGSYVSGGVNQDLKPLWLGYDGDYDTYTKANVTISGNTEITINVTYSKPSNMFGAIWQVKYSDVSITNITIPIDCYNYDNNNLYLYQKDSYASFTGFQTINLYCRNSTGLRLLFNNVSLSNALYEESIFWINAYGDANSTKTVQNYLPILNSLTIQTFNLTDMTTPYNLNNTDNNYICSYQNINLLFNITDVEGNNVSVNYQVYRNNVLIQNTNTAFLDYYNNVNNNYAPLPLTSGIWKDYSFNIGDRIVLKYKFNDSVESTNLTDANITMIVVGCGDFFHLPTNNNNYDGQQYNTQSLPFNYTLFGYNSSYTLSGQSVTCGLYQDGVNIQNNTFTLIPLNNTVNYVVNYSTVEESNLTYYMRCDYYYNGTLYQSIQTSNISFWIDNVNPSINTTYVSLSYILPPTDNETATFVVQDSSIYSVNGYVNGFMLNNYSSIYSTQFDLNMSYNVSNLTSNNKGLYNITVVAKDGHTKNAIDDIPFLNNKFSKQIEFYFNNYQDKVIIKSINDFQTFSDLIAYKDVDRYKYNHTRNDLLEDLSVSKYRVTSTQKIDVYNGNKYPAWLVIPNIKNGLWLDLKIFGRDDFVYNPTERFDSNKDYMSLVTGTNKLYYVLNVIDDYNVEVYIYNVNQEKIEFHSLGELNTETQVYYFANMNITETKLADNIVETKSQTGALLIDSFMTGMFNYTNATLVYNLSYVYALNQTYTNTSINSVDKIFDRNYSSYAFANAGTTGLLNLTYVLPTVPTDLNYINMSLDYAVNSRNVSSNNSLVIPTECIINDTVNVIYYMRNNNGFADNGYNFSCVNGTNSTYTLVTYTNATDMYASFLYEITGLKINYYFDNLNITYNKTSSNGADYYTATLTTPYITDSYPHVVTYYWEYSIGLNNGTVVSSSTTPSYQNIYSFNVYDCNVNPNSYEILRLTCYDEYNYNTTTNCTINIDASFNVGTYNLTNGFAFTGNYTYGICVPFNTNYSFTSVMEYFGNGYSNRKYYVNNLYTNSDKQIVNLYLLNDTKTSEILFTLKDQITNKELGSYYIEILRYYPELQGYLLVEKERTTSFDGTAIGKLVLYDPFYKFIIKDPSDTNILLVTDMTRITELTKEIRINTNPNYLSGYTVMTKDVVGDVSCNKTNKICTFTYSSTVGSVQQANMKVYRNSLGVSTLIYNGLLNSSSGQLIFNISTVDSNVTGNEYMAIGYIHTNTTYSNLLNSMDTISYFTDMTFAFGNIGLFLGLLLMIGISMLLVRYGAIGIILSASGVFVFLMFLGVISGFDGVIVISIIIMSAIWISKLRS